MKDREEYISILEQDNAELKKQLEELDKKLFLNKNELNMREKSIDNKLNQQKEFIKYLEAKIEVVENKIFNLPITSNERNYLVNVENDLIEILQKYKEIIRGDK